MLARRYLASVALLLAPQVVMADVAEDRVAILVTAIESAGCIVNEANQAAVLAATGMTEEEAGAIVLLLLDTGRAEPIGDDLKLTTGNCI